MTNPNENYNPPTQSINHSPKTVALSNKLKRNQLKLSKTADTEAPASKRMAFFILGMVERVDFSKTPTVTLGRYDRISRMEGQIDLTGYDAVKKGVSREHCKIELRDDQLFVTDLGSTNGTFIGSKRLEPNQTQILPRGTELVIGRLPVHIVSSG
jgi:hypothetical protein